MTSKKIKIIDIETAKTIEREMNEQEIADLESYNLLKQQLDNEQAAKEAARQSALDKLAALGLSPEEISAIAGGN